MSYTFSKIIESSFDDTVATVTERLKEQGFGILTEIDIKNTLKKKLDVDVPEHKILGACNPPFAYEALQTEPNISAMLPCNVTVREMENGKINVSAVDPVASMTAVKNNKLEEVAMKVQSKLKAVIESL